MKGYLKSFSVGFLLVGLLSVFSSASATPPQPWGAKFVISHMNLNTTGFVSWFKVVNWENDSIMDISADIIYTLADGTEGSFDDAALGSVDANGVATVGEATILSAIGNPTQPVDASLVVYLNNPNAIVKAEKKASDGRVAIPVERFYLLGDPSL